MGEDGRIRSRLLVGRRLNGVGLSRRVRDLFSHKDFWLSDIGSLFGRDSDDIDESLGYFLR